MANSILNSDVTYASLISSAAASLYSVLSSSSVSTGTYRNNTASFTIGSGVTCGTNEAGFTSHSKSVTLTETENRSAIQLQHKQRLLTILQRL